MKTSVAIIVAAAGVAMAKPAFLNTNFDVVPNEPFTLKFSGCEKPCEIILLNGDPKNLQEVQTIVPATDGSEATIRLSKAFDKDTYAFKIVDSDGEYNYSEQFTFEGTNKPTPTEVSTTAEATSTSATASSSTSAKATTTLVTISSESSAATTPAASKTETETATTTGSSSSQQTTTSSDRDQSGAAVRLGSSHASLAVAVVALVGYFL
ncbi:hypothetical protein NLU13_3883 [Sarocladium strictum]|uniref:Yeast cell wall synthesis Kre9/Knh1-like N-terminal domain-containing protein n=1 Tax=Sarocladium strictum TaxID=5046 RepID=A0AA39GHW2_SARSR|nr:hypothetical protein NLU13_3883 [Sarocladium strictum]